MTTFAFYQTDKAKRYEDYASSYKFDQTEPTPWMSLRKDLRDCKVTLITTAGLRLKNQPQYTISNGGSTEYRELPINLKKSDVVISHTGFNTEPAQKDINVIAPVDILIEYAEQRFFAELNETFFSFLGGRSNLEALAASAREVAYNLRAHNVDAVLIFPASHTCNETVGIISREMEKGGVSTVSLITIKEIAQEIKLPRALFINFPFGYTLGKPYLLPLQRSIVNDMITTLKTLDRPGKIIDLQYKWEGMAE